MNYKNYDSLVVGMERMKAINDFIYAIKKGTKVFMQVQSSSRAEGEPITFGGQIRACSSSENQITEATKEVWEEGDRLVQANLIASLEEARELLKKRLESLGFEFVEAAPNKGSK